VTGGEFAAAMPKKSNFGNRERCGLPHCALFVSLCHCRVERKSGTICCVKYWEIIADNLKKRGWSYGYVSAVDSQGRAIWIVDAHRDDGKRFVVRADEKLTAFLELGKGDSPVRGEFDLISAIEIRFGTAFALRNTFARTYAIWRIY